jgi:hypothetical protein
LTIGRGNRRCGLAAGTLAALVAGCASSQRPAATDTQGSWDRGPAVAETEAAPVEAPSVRATARDLSVEVSPSLSYVAREGSSTEVMRIERGPPAPGPDGRMRWTVRRSRAARPDAGFEPMSEQVFVLLDDGSVAIAEDIVHDEQVEVVFDPPMVVMPAELAAGTFQQTVQMLVHPLGNRARSKGKGPVRQSIQLLGGETIQTPAGTVEAVHIRQEFVASLNPAEVTNTTDQWFVPRIGLVAEKRSERTLVLGVPLRSSREEWVVETIPEQRW